jgi:hypothetical protein
VVLDDSTRTDPVEYWIISAKRLAVIPMPPRTREELRPDPAAAPPSDQSDDLLPRPLLLVSFEASAA